MCKRGVEECRKKPRKTLSRRGPLLFYLCICRLCVLVLCVVGTGSRHVTKPRTPCTTTVSLLKPTSFYDRSDSLPSFTQWSGV